MCSKSGVHLLPVSVSPPVWLLLSQSVVELISTALSNPLSPVVDNTEQTVCQRSSRLLKVEFKHAAVVENLFALWSRTIAGS